MHTNVWMNATNGHHFTESQDGILLNGKPVSEWPEWVQGEPDMVFGETQGWHGGECPVDANTLVRCVFRERNPYIGPAIYPGLPPNAKASMWQHAPAPRRHDPQMDIVAYQVSVD